ncbi:hypothetical protein F2Q68_00004838 [Brassica cretica]|uniref:Uncharacterized protein n=1 Tax=Brassica cretica TaxID=69181 RepID=A0A8S9JF77_BRACR|nr:hypothetical protein F2Q68_00004838 [Brassica cretica]
MVEELPPVGFRFYPTEVELDGGHATIYSLIPILDVFNVEPTQLPSTYAIMQTSLAIYDLDDNNESWSVV